MRKIRFDTYISEKYPLGSGDERKDKVRKETVFSNSEVVKSFFYILVIP